MRVFVLLAIVAMTASLVACYTPPPVGPMIWTMASPDPRVVSLTRASFVETSGVTDAVLLECGLDRKIPERIARRSPVPVVLAEQPYGGARVLSLEVTHIFALPGGAWSGPKSLTLRGELIEDGIVTASFDARRTTVRGVGTCDMLDLIVDVLAKDIRPWLVAPSLNAGLGELQ